jgi:4-amino-4-deoxy-L-arabinose transferase-like glycosyltransferase
MNADLPCRTDRRLTLRVAAIACLLSCLLAALDLWANRDGFDPDGTSYLDMADAYCRGDWRTALVGHWSPLYAWLLALMMWVFNPSPQWEFTAVHVLNFLIYLVTLASFSIFMRELLRADKAAAANERLPDWSWLVLGYSLFTWSTIRLIPPHLPEPDAIVCALVYLIFSILFRIRGGTVSWGESIFLGVLLGLGYLTKGIMFPMAFVFTGVALLLAGRSAKKLFRIIVAFSVFLLLSLPYIVVLSHANKRWMFSDSGRLNYAWYVNGIKRWNHWQGEEAIHGTPVHPTRKIYDNPPMYEFGTPFKVTYPPWYNPSYWYEGMKLTLDPRAQLSVVARNTKSLLFFLANSPGSAAPKQPTYYVIDYDKTFGCLLTLFCLVVLANLGRVRIFRGIAEHWFVLLPIAAVLGAYACLVFEGRYIPAYVAVLWMVLFRSIVIPHSKESKRIFTAVLVSAALIAAITVATGTGRAVFDAARYFVDGKTEAPFWQSGYTNWKVAKYLHNAGLHAGDPVGAVGWTYSPYWARMARVHIIAEVPEEGATAFWSSDTAKRAIVMQLFQDVGAKAVVAKAGYINKQRQHVWDLNGLPGEPSPLIPIMPISVQSPTSPSGPVPVNWRHIADTDYYVYLFRASGE